MVIYAWWQPAKIPIPALWRVWPFLLGFQVLFFYATGRSLHSPHYTSVGLPLMLFPWAAFLAHILQFLPKHSWTRLHLTTREILTISLSVVIFITGVRNYDRGYERGKWHYRAINKALDEISKFSQKVAVKKTKFPFVPYHHQYDSLLVFFIKNFRSDFVLDDKSKWLLRPQARWWPASAQNLPFIEHKGQTYEVFKTFDPGITLYQKK
jgi:hypothetical protein